MLKRLAAVCLACVLASTSGTVLVCELVVCSVAGSQSTSGRSSDAHECHESPAPADGVGLSAGSAGCGHDAAGTLFVDSVPAKASDVDAALPGGVAAPKPVISSTFAAQRLHSSRPHLRAPLVVTLRV